MNPALAFASVTIRYPGNDRDVVSDISFCVDKGERVALLGLNGSGKTSLLLAAAGLAPFTGSIIVDGIAVEKRTMREARDRLGFLFNVPEDQILFPRVIDDVAFGLVRKGVTGDAAREKAARMLTLLGVGELAQRSPFQLSHGQRQRVALAGALVTAPAVLLLDEPTSALDPPGRISLTNVIEGLDAAALIATHDIDFAARTCGRFLFIRDGSLLVCADSTEARRLILGGT